MARRRADKAFTGAAGKTVESIEYADNSDYQALVVTFTDDKALAFEFSARAAVQASFLARNRRDLELIRQYSPVSSRVSKKV
jgi:hypothetical protein